MTESLLDFWPTAEAVHQTIVSEAEEFDEDVFLAVHQPMSFRRTSAGSAKGRDVVKSEKDLLKFFLSDTAEGTRILPIQGPSGIGKSHAIKWLHAEVQKARWDTAHIVWVHKGASLRQVLSDVIEGLTGEQYRKFREALEGAREKLGVENLAELLRTRLREELKHPSRLPEEPDLKGFWGAYGGEGMLPSLLGDEEAWIHHFFKEGEGPIARISEQLGTSGGRHEDNRKHQFVVDDLKLPASVERGLSATAKQFYTILNTAEGIDFREQACAVLNCALDPAKLGLLDLGANSLAELFGDVRHGLFKEGKELILLIEDFVAMSGIRGALLDVMVTPGGNRDWCTMRTALAVTPGEYGSASLPETVKTRAVYEWWLDEQPGDDQKIVDEAMDLIGAYLNAARIGVEGVRSSGGPQPRFSPKDPDESRDQLLAAFGSSPASQYPIFPFNRNAVEQLLRTHCVDSNEQLVRMPRKVITGIFRPILGFRDAFQNGEFPVPDDDIPSAIDADITLEVEKKGATTERDRYLTLLGAWGGQPTNGAEANALADEVYEVFGLDPLTFETSGQKEVSPDPRIIPDPSKVSPRPRENYTTEFEAWRSKGEELPQGLAAKIRKATARILFGSIPPDHAGLPQYSSADLERYVYIARARGGGALEPKDAAVVICTEDDLSDKGVAARVQKELEALLEWSKVGTGGCTEVSYVQVAAFVTHHRPATIQWLASRPHEAKTSGTPTVTLLEGVLLAGKLLGVASTLKTSKAALVKSLFARPTEDASYGDDQWGTFLDWVHDKILGQGGSWRSHLVDSFAATQGGTGSTPMAFDVAAIWPDLQSAAEPKWAQPQGGPSGIATTAGEFQRRFNKVVPERVSTLIAWHARVSAWKDTSTKHELIADMREVLDQANKAGVISDADKLQRLRRKVSDLQDSIFETTHNQAAKVEEADDDAAKARACGAVDSGVVQFVGELVAEWEAVISAVDQSIKHKLGHAPTGDSNALLAPLHREMGRLSDQLDRIEGTTG